MNVYIQEVVATVRSVSSDSVLAPRALEKIVTTVMGAMRAERAHEDQTKKDRKVTSGVRDEQEGD